MKFCAGICWIMLFINCRQGGMSFKVDEIAFIPNAQTPNLCLTAEDDLYLTWTHEVNDSTDALNFSKIDQDTLTETQEFAQGQDWFINWADFPSMAVMAGSGSTMVANFLQKRQGGANYNYDIKLAFTRGGNTFRIIDTLHDSVPAEHGFVSLLPYRFNNIMVTWLDGRAMTSGHGQSNHENQHGSMQLRSSFIDMEGKITQNLLIDDRVCECCNTDMALTAKGPILVYRNRSEDEERDIYYCLYQNGQWTTAKPVNTDHWKIMGCPVNGPAVSALKEKVAVVYYTEVNQLPEIKLCLSYNSGENFTIIKTISTHHTQGRLDVCWIDSTRLAVSYLDKHNKSDDSTFLMIKLFDQYGTVMHDQSITTLSASRKTGFPILESKYGTLYLAFTETKNEQETNVRLKKIDIN